MYDSGDVIQCTSKFHAEVAKPNAYIASVILTDALCVFEGGGDRTRVLNCISLDKNRDIDHCMPELAALWLQLSDIDEHELARIVTICESWSSLPDQIKLAIESLVQSGLSCAAEVSTT